MLPSHVLEQAILPFSSLQDLANLFSSSPDLAEVVEDFVLNQYKISEFETNVLRTATLSGIDNALITFAQQGNKDVVSFLLSRGAKISIESTNAACFNAQQEIFFYLLSFVQHPEPHYQQGLISASRSGSVSIAKLFCSRCNEDSKHTALVHASKNNHEDFVRFLLANGAAPSSFDDEALLAASKNGFWSIVRLLVQRGARSLNNQALKAAIISGHSSVVYVLLITGTSLSIPDFEPLIYAVTSGFENTVRILLSFGANVHAKNEKALMYASMRGYYRIVHLLIDAGADVDSENNIALVQAARKGHEDIVRLLLSASQENGVEQRNNVLRHGAANGHANIVSLALEEGADPLADNSFALTFAHRRGYSHIVDLLTTASICSETVQISV